MAIILADPATSIEALGVSIAYAAQTVEERQIWLASDPTNSPCPCPAYSKQTLE